MITALPSCLPQSHASLTFNTCYYQILPFSPFVPQFLISPGSAALHISSDILYNFTSLTFPVNYHK